MKLWDNESGECIISIDVKAVVSVIVNLLAKLFGVSSATIRAEMAELERMGYISQPHTSAGRIPTDKGYRLYVNGLSDEKDQHLPGPRGERALTARVSSGGLPERTIRNAVDTPHDAC